MRSLRVQHRLHRDHAFVDRPRIFAKFSMQVYQFADPNQQRFGVGDVALRLDEAPELLGTINHRQIVADALQFDSRSKHFHVIAERRDAMYDRPAILIADDEWETSEVLRILIERTYPCRAVVARDGASAVARCLARRPKVCQLDVYMPVMNGIQAAHAIRRALTADAPRLLAYTGRMVEEAACSGAFDGVLVKPTRIDDLKREIGPYLLA